MQIIKTYPPEIEASRERLFTLIETVKAEEFALLQRVPEYARPREERRIQQRFLARCAPFTAELARLEMFAQVSVVMEAPEGEVVAR